MADQDERNVYRFAGFTVDVTRRQLLGSDGPVQLTSKAFETLLVLIGRAGDTVTKLELMNAVWADTAVEENNLTQQISTLRRAFGERPDDHSFIVTVPGKGYKFVAEIRQDVDVEVMQGFVPAPFTGRSAGWLFSRDAGAVRGYALAMAFIALVGFSFVWSIVRNYEADRPQSLAVLNFKVSASGDEFIGNGISETLRARLGSVQDLTVRPGDSVSADLDALAVGRQLQVDTVVTGSVQRDRNRVRVAVEMLDVAAGKIIWGGTFDDSTSNLFALQDSIASEVARELHINLVSGGDLDGRLLPAATELQAMLRGTHDLLFRRPETASV